MNKRVLHWESRIGRRLRLRDLHILFAVAQYGSMAKAAKHLGISQPSISEAIADLENTVGVRLLDRSPQGASTTIYGDALLRRGRAAFDELRQGIRDIEFLADPTVGELRIASPETLTAGFLPAVIERMSRKYPGIVFHVVQANTVTLEFRELRERTVDLALARLTQPLASDDLHAEKTGLRHLSMDRCVPGTHPRRRRDVSAQGAEGGGKTPPRRVVCRDARRRFCAGPHPAVEGLARRHDRSAVHRMGAGFR